MLPFSKFVLVVQQSALDKKQQEELTAFFARASQHDIESILRVCEQVPDAIRGLYQLVQRKKHALQNSDWNEWIRIMDDENRALAAINSLE